jgi:hypothetical protein
LFIAEFLGEQTGFNVVRGTWSGSDRVNGSRPSTAPDAKSRQSYLFLLCEASPGIARTIPAENLENGISHHKRVILAEDAHF